MTLKLMETHVAFLSIGSNLGDRNANCRKGLDQIGAVDGIVLTQISNFYETEPVDYSDQGWFVNAAARVETTLLPEPLLDELKRIEKIVGRTEKTVRFGPRVLDLDILLFDDWIIQTDRLILPHPRMHERRFVLTPVCDIDPRVIHPVLNRSVKAILGDLSGECHQQVIRLETD